MGYSDDYYRYVVKGIPIKPVGIKTKYTLTIGETTYTYSSTIKRNNLSGNGEVWLTSEKYTYVYSGKTIKPKAKKKCYVQIRTYKKVGSKTYYSKWSKKKTVKTK